MKTEPQESNRTRRGKSPRYRTVTEALRRQLRDGSLAAGVKLPALRELADRYKVSTNTVRNAIRVLEREGCLYRVPDVGAFVKPTYPSPSVARQTTIALITLDIGGAFEMGIARGIERACQDRGWGLQIFDSRSDPALEQRNLSRLDRALTHGAIVMPTGSDENIESLFKLKLTNFPLVLVDRTITGLRVDVVASDHQKGAYLGTRHLVERGHSVVRMITEPAGAASIGARIEGYERALIDVGIEPRREWKVWVDPDVSTHGVQSDRRWLGGYEAALPALRQLEPPLAFFALNDYVGWGLYEACRELGLRVPDDVSIVCFDDSDITRAMAPPMTTVAQRAGEIGRRAVELLEKRLRVGGTDDGETEQILVDIDLIERRSVRTMPSPG